MFFNKVKTWILTCYCCLVFFRKVIVAFSHFHNFVIGTFIAFMLVIAFKKYRNTQRRDQFLLLLHSHPQLTIQISFLKVTFQLLVNLFGLFVVLLNCKKFFIEEIRFAFFRGEWKVEREKFSTDHKVR